MTGAVPGTLDILFVGTLPPHPGGSAISAGQILARLARRGHRVRAVAPMTQAADRAGDVFAVGHPELHVVRFEVPHFDASPNIPVSDAYRAAEGARLRSLLPRLIGERRPDVIFVGRETFAWHVPDLARRHGLPCVLRTPGATSHGVLSGTYPERFGARLLEHYRQADLLVSPGRHLAEQLTARGVGPVRVIPTAIDLHDFCPRPKPTHLLERLGIASQDVVVVHASNMKDIKRPQDVVVSASQALSRDPRLVYVMVGDGPSRARAEEMSRAAGVGARFRFVGWVDYASIPDYMNLADLVAVPSECEGLARVYIEALASGSVLVASDIPPAREVVEEGRTGLLFGVGATDALAAQTLRAAGDPELRARIGRLGRARSATHGVDQAAADYALLLAEAVERHCAGGRAR